MIEINSKIPYIMSYDETYTVRCKAKIYNISDKKSAELVIHKRTLPSNIVLKTDYNAVLITKKGVVRFKTNTFKHKNIIRYKIPLSIAKAYLESKTIEADVIIRDNIMLIVQSGINVQNIIQNTEDNIKNDRRDEEVITINTIGGDRKWQ
ncbi:hypothetical protein [Thermococcus peptonophilus]|uniref:Uncharacterized protein n=1 Tax=Thermococcus peptonophilus TaxID=53952 RepID=A0A142CVJ9_9EURY|nr:hypothetical protein [Thermococcus peptonophilus]AMQ18801.1 hypothetical protein A0127_06250 [Thermococcus peptonophilus]